ncbi:MAG: LuxR C-terminal-related transcriptional regulator [Alphaproteobacteria bacterium]
MTELTLLDAPSDRRRDALSWAAANRRWSKAIADAVAAETAALAIRNIGWGLAALFDADTWYVIFFREGEVPIMFDYFDADTRHDRYADGPYLLDPFYTSFLNGDPPGSYLKRDISPEDLSEIEPYLSYDQEIFGPMEEAGLVTDIDGNTRSLVCFSRAITRPHRCEYDQRHIAVLDIVAPVVEAFVTRLWRETAGQNTQAQGSRSRKHAQIEKVLTSFQAEHLTAREKDVCNLMIKGFNAREISGFLDISYGTARNHIKKVYQKLDVSSQSELCGLFIEQLLNLETL